jgi:hypothetical protein
MRTAPAAPFTAGDPSTSGTVAGNRSTNVPLVDESYRSALINRR